TVSSKSAMECTGEEATGNRRRPTRSNPDVRSVDRVALFQGVVGGFADEALALFEGGDLVFEAGDGAGLPDVAQDALQAGDRGLEGGVRVKDHGEAHPRQLLLREDGRVAAVDEVDQEGRVDRGRDAGDVRGAARTFDEEAVRAGGECALGAV